MIKKKFWHYVCCSTVYVQLINNYCFGEVFQEFLFNLIEFVEDFQQRIFGDVIVDTRTMDWSMIGLRTIFSFIRERNLEISKQIFANFNRYKLNLFIQKAFYIY